MTAQPTDIAIFFVSFAACIYCIVLSRRLKALQNTKDGLGATIMALSKSISAMSATTEEARTEANALATHLSGLLEEAGKTATRVESMTKTMESKHTYALRQVDTAKKELSSSLHEMLEESKAQILEMTTLLRQWKSVSTTYDNVHERGHKDTSLFDTSTKGA